MKKFSIDDMEEADDEKLAKILNTTYVFVCKKLEDADQKAKDNYERVLNDIVKIESAFPAPKEYKIDFDPNSKS